MLLTQVSPGCKGDPARRSPVCPSLVGANNEQLYTETLPGLCPQPQKKGRKKKLQRASYRVLRLSRKTIHVRSAARTMDGGKGAVRYRGVPVSAAIVEG